MIYFHNFPFYLICNINNASKVNTSTLKPNMFDPTHHKLQIDILLKAQSINWDPTKRADNLNSLHKFASSLWLVKLRDYFLIMRNYVSESRKCRIIHKIDITWNNRLLISLIDWMRWVMLLKHTSLKNLNSSFKLQHYKGKYNNKRNYKLISMRVESQIYWMK